MPQPPRGSLLGVHFAVVGEVAATRLPRELARPVEHRGADGVLAGHCYFVGGVEQAVDHRVEAGAGDRDRAAQLHPREVVDPGEVAQPVQQPGQLIAASGVEARDDAVQHAVPELAAL